MKRAPFLVAISVSLCIGIGQVLAANDLVGGFLKGLQAIIVAYERLQDTIDQHIAQIERRQFQLKNDKQGLTDTIANERGSEPIKFYQDLQPAIQKLEITIRCLRGNLSDLGTQIRDQSWIDGVQVERNLSQGLREKTGMISEMVRNLGTYVPYDTDFIDALKKETEEASKLAEKLSDASLVFAQKLDPNLALPTNRERRCVMASGSL